jgi:uncharacterized protein (TIGR01615 family)
VAQGLVQSASVAERNLLADASRLAERCGKGKAECRRAVADGLCALGYDAGVCKSRWERTPTYPAGTDETNRSHPLPLSRRAVVADHAVRLRVCAGEHEYIDAVVGAEAARLVVEVDFRSHFELARSTKAYRAALQALPPLFVGTLERLGKIVAVVAEAARQSLKNKGLHFPPWRKPEYMRAKWLSPHARCGRDGKASVVPVQAACFSGEFQLVFDRKTNRGAGAPSEDRIKVVVSPWRPSEEASSKPKAKVVMGFAAVL